MAQATRSRVSANVVSGAVTVGYYRIGILKSGGRRPRRSLRDDPSPPACPGQIQ